MIIIFFVHPNEYSYYINVQGFVGVKVVDVLPPSIISACAIS